MTVDGPAAGVVREGLLQGARRARSRHRRRRSPRRTASWPASSTPTPTPVTPRPRSASRRSPPPTTWSATRPSARSTTRSASSGPMGGMFGAGRRRWPRGGDQGFSFTFDGRRPRRPARQPLRPRVVAGAAARPAASGPRRGRRPRGRAAPCRSPTPSTASPRRCTSPPTRPARTCHGSGAEPGTTPHACPICEGRGVVDDNQGLFSFSQPCPNCHGTGVVVDDPCPTCRGTGVERRQREVKVRIPAGVARRPAHPAEGPRRARPQRRSRRRPVRHGAGAARPGVRARRRQPHGQRAGHLPRGRARRRRPGARCSTAARSRSGSGPARSRATSTG